MLTLNDGRSELWQWDTNRKLTVDTECSQVHFSNKVFGRSIDVDVVDGVAIIPDILLQTDKDLNAWAFVGTAESGYTKISKVFKVNKRNKPADYVFAPTDQTTLEEILNRIDDLENRPGGDVSKEDIQDAVNDYLDKNPVSVEEKDPTVPNWAKRPHKPTYTAEEVGAQPKGDYVLRDELPKIPETLPNPHKLTFTGAVTAEYDGSKPVEVEIPQGGGGGIEVTGAEVGQTIVVKAVDDTGRPTSWTPADLDSPDEYITLFHKKFDVNVASTDEWGGEYLKHDYRHFWATDLDGNDVQADGIHVRVHVPKQTENNVTSGEMKIYVGKGKPTNWQSWGGVYQQQPYIGYSTFTTTNGQEVWAKWDYDLRTRTLTATNAANRGCNGNFSGISIHSATSFDLAVAKNNWDYLSGVQLDLVSGSLPAGTEILIYARKLNAKKVPDIPKWGV